MCELNFFQFCWKKWKDWVSTSHMWQRRRTMGKEDEKCRNKKKGQMEHDTDR